MDADELQEYFYIEQAEVREFSTESEDEDTDSDSEIEFDTLERLQAGSCDEEKQEEPSHSIPEQSGSQISAEHSLKEISGCTCELNSCISLFDSRELNQVREQNRSLDKSMLDMVILGRISAVINRSEYRDMKTHSSKRRKLSRSEYTHEGVPICRQAFCFLNNIGDGKLSVLTKHYMKNGAVPRMFKHKGRNSNAVSFDQAKRVIDFLKSVCSLHALALPGRVPGFKKTEVMVLPSDLTVTSIWQDYCAACRSENMPYRSRSSFRRIWKQVLPMLIISKPSSDLCWTCQQHNYRYKSVINHTEQQKQSLIDQQQEHLRLAMLTRQYMNDCTERCKGYLTPNMMLGPNAPLPGPEEAHYCFDFAQQLHYPCDPHQPGPLFFKTPRKCGVFGVCCPMFPSQVNYLIDEAVSTSKGANAVISFIHHFLEHYGLGEKKLILHADNCCGQNKNNAMINYLAWRVAHGLHEEINFNFLIAGHTKFCCDSCFGLLKKQTRRTKLTCLEDISQAVIRSSVVNKVQLVGNQMGEVVVKVYDWTNFLVKSKLQGIKKYHQFRMAAQKKGILEMKFYPDSPDWKEHRAFQHQVPEGLPVEIKPAGLSLQRQAYLAKEIREFCPPETRDLVCPFPKDEHQDITNASSIA